MTATHNTLRYRTLVGTIITQFALGSVYTWSLFNAQLSTRLGEPVSKVAFAFGLLSLALALASSLAGKLQEHFSVRQIAASAGVLLGVGFFLTSQAHNLIALYLFAGVMVGFADGTGYLLTLSNCVKWFPERKGLISAFAIGAYGLGSLGFKYINLMLLSRFGLEHAFQFWGAIAMCMIIVGAYLMSDAPRQENAVSRASSTRDFTLAEAMRQPHYWMLAVMFLTFCMGGLYVIGVAKDVGESYVRLPAALAANAVAVIAVANLGGRLVLGVLSDRMPRIWVIAIAQVAALFGMLMLLFVALDSTTFFIAIACIAFSFGGAITVYPSLVSDFFGLNNLTKNYGVIYLGFGVGSIIGSVVASLFGGFIAAFHLILVLQVVSLLLMLVVRRLPMAVVAAPVMSAKPRLHARGLRELRAN
jgi:MFS transporter, OFA family, oxalate/formate antiporter